MANFFDKLVLGLVSFVIIVVIGGGAVSLLFAAMYIEVRTVLDSGSQAGVFLLCTMLALVVIGLWVTLTSSERGFAPFLERGKKEVHQ